MARIRTIKPDFFTSEDIVSMTPRARLLYIALWCEADKEGRLTWRPITFRMRYMPADDVDINELCSELTNSGLVSLYGDGLAYIPGFSRHQHVNPRESASVLPEPPGWITEGPKNVGTNMREEVVEDLAKDGQTINSVRVKSGIDASILDPHAQGGREGKGKVIRVIDASRVHGFPPGFDAFWDLYPRKTAKTTAAKAYARLAPNADLQAKILSSVLAQSKSPEWTKDGGQFIPHPATWINSGRWEDVLDSPGYVRDVFAGAI